MSVQPTSIVIMCVMYKQTRNTACCRHIVHYICRVLCTINSTHVICTGTCNRSCIRSVHVRDMQWTPLLVQSRRVSTRMRCEPPPKCRTRQDRDRNKRLWPHIPRLLCRASHMLQQCRFGWRDVFHCPRNMCHQLCPYSTGWTPSVVHYN